MTYTVQAISRTVDVNSKKTETEETICDLLSIFDSLNKLRETLNRLTYALQVRNMEISLKEKR